MLSGLRRLSHSRRFESAASRCSLLPLFQAVLDQAVADVDRAVGVGGDVGVVRHDDNCEVLLFVELLEQLHRFIAGVGIERTGWLVGEQQ